MPIYDFKCEKCGHTFEESLKIVDRGMPTESPCERQLHRAAPICGGEVKRIHNVSWSYTRDLTAGHEERREADKLISK